MNNLREHQLSNRSLFLLGLDLLAVYVCVFSQLYSMLTLSGPVETSISFSCLLLLLAGGKYHAHKETRLWFFPLLIIYANLLINYSNSLIRECVVWSVGVLLITGAYNTRYYRRFLHILFVAGIVYALSLLLEFVFPDVYFSYFYPLFKLDYADTVSRLWNSMLNIPTGLSHQIGYSLAYVIISFGLYFFVYRKKMTKGSSVILFALFLLALLIGKKRMHFASTLFSVGLVYSLSVTGKKRVNRIAIILILFVVGIFIALSVLDHYGIGSVFDRYQEALEMSSHNESISESRVDLRQDAISLWESSPVFGVGWLEYGRQGFEFTTAHNVFLQLLCETGIVGFVLFLIPVFSGLWKAFSLLWHHKGLPESALGIVQFSAFYQLFFVLYFFTGNPLNDYPYLLPYFVCVAITLYYSERGSQIHFSSYKK